MNTRMLALVLGGVLVGGLDSWARCQNELPDRLGSDSEQADIEGSAVDQHGNVVPFAFVTLQRSLFVRTAVADDQGRFRFTGVPVGYYQLQAEAQGFLPGGGEVDLTSGDLSERAFVTLTRKEDATPPDEVVTLKALAAPPAALKAYQRGIAHLSRRHLESALKEFDLALSAYSEFEAARAVRGVTLLQLGRMEDARADLEEALHLDPEAYDANLGMGMTCNDLERFAEAETYLKKAHAIRPNEWAPELELGAAYYGMRRLEEAERELKSALDDGSTEPSAYLLLANIAIQGQRRSDALDAMRRYLRAAPRGPQADEVKKRIRELSE